MTVPPLPSRMSRKTPYTFTCGRCCRCCRFKKIQMNPYEVARLAGNLGMTTTAFIRRHTLEGGTFLRFDDNSVCPFLGKDGCGVHADRPLVCRLYPLGRHVAENGDEWFTERVCDEGCVGSRGEKGCLDAYLEAQGAAPFMRAADLYLGLYWKLTAHLEAAGEDTSVKCHPQSDWTDLDAAVSRYCRQTRRTLPDSLEERMALHICAIETWAQLPQQGGVS